MPHLPQVALLAATLGLVAASVHQTHAAEPYRFEDRLILADDGQPGDRFSNDFAVNDRFIVASADGRERDGVPARSIYVFDTQTGQQLRRIDGEGQYFGDDLALSNNLILSRNTRPKYATGSGGTEPFYELFDASTGQPLGSLVNKDQDKPGFRLGEQADGAQFSENIALIPGSFNEGTDNLFRRHGVYVFDVSNPSQPKQAARLSAPLPNQSSFGQDIAMDGSLAIIGDPNFDLINQLSSVGNASLYDLSDPYNPELLSTFTAQTPRENGDFGQGVAIDGDLVAISEAITDPTVPRGVRNGFTFFDISDPRNPVRVGRLDQPTLEPGQSKLRFSTNSVFNNDRLLISNPLIKTATEDLNVGGALLYDVSDLNNIVLLDVLSTAPPDGGARVGDLIELEGDVAYMSAAGFGGSSQNPDAPGRIFVYDIPEPNALSLLAVAALTLRRRHA